jgi:hypothetical protein
VRIAQDPLPPPLAAPLAPALDGLAAALSDWLGACGAALAGRAPPPALDGVGAAFAAFAAALAALRGAGVMRDLPGPAVAQAFALDFALEQLHQDLRDLRARTAELARGAADAPANPG